MSFSTRIVSVKLTGGEHAMAMFGASFRVKNSIDMNIGAVQGEPMDRRALNHILGAFGEVGAAKLLDKFWSPADAATMFNGDVGPFEVKAVQFDPDEERRLIVQPKNDGDRRYILAVVKLPVISLVGWIYGDDAKRPEWFKTYREGGGAYYVPREALRGMDEWEE